MLVAEKPKMTVAELQQKLQQNDWWLVRAIERLHSFQTDQEQNAESTLEDNGVGFNSPDAPFLSSLAEQIKKWRAGETTYNFPLSRRQMEKAREKINKYARQLLRYMNGQI